MSFTKSYQMAFGAALALHALIFLMLIEQTQNARPVMELTTKNDAVHTNPARHQPNNELMRATTVDAKQVEETINRIKTKRAQKEQAEDRRQKKLEEQAKQARQERIEEQQRLKALQEESIARKKKIANEKRRLKQLKEQQENETKRLAEAKKQQQEAALKIAAINKRAQEEKDRIERVQKQQEALEKAKADAEKKARIAGEVNRYQALIVNAISRRWILPEQVNPNLFSRFRIRLAPDGSVLEAALTRSSGDSILDRSAQSAIYKASPLPVSSDSEVFNVLREINLTVRPENARG